MAYPRNIVLFAALISFDQLSKYIIRTSGGFYICNPNLAFGIKPAYFFIVLAIIIVSTIIFSLGNHKSQISNNKQAQNQNEQNSKQSWICNFGNRNLFDIWNLRFGILLIIAGGISNIIDRLYFGCVIDFINLKIWPVFNLADIYITIGTIAIIMKHVTYNIKQKMD